jgi:hypothetical protein
MEPEGSLRCPGVVREAARVEGPDVSATPVRAPIPLGGLAVGLTGPP